MTDLVEALRIEGNLRVNEKEEIFGNRKSREDRIADDLCYQAASRISQQDAELERLRREVEEAREALKPFAERAARFDDIPGIYRCNDNVELWQDGNWRCDLTVGDLRKARSAIAGISEPEETRT